MQPRNNYREAEKRLTVSLRETQFEDTVNIPDKWRKDPNAPEPRDLGFYVPTGNRKLDAILAGAMPPILYGGSMSGVAAWGYDAVEHEGRMYIPKGASWITQPMAEMFRSEDDRRAVLAHELVHWTKELGRAPRPLTGVNEDSVIAGNAEFPPGYAAEELVAEIGAALLLDAIGSDPQWDERAHYALNWTGAFSDAQQAHAAWSWAMKQAELAVDYLLQFAEGVD